MMTQILSLFSCLNGTKLNETDMLSVINTSSFWSLFYIFVHFDISTNHFYVDVKS